MPTTRICLDCNHLYTPPTNPQTKHKNRCPNCYPAYLKRQPRGTHHNTPTRRHRAAFYSSTKWKRARQAALNRDATCTQCGTTQNLQVHHLTSLTEAPELALDLDNLATLCASCHAKQSNATKRQRRTR